jgi:hypothetical protein
VPPARRRKPPLTVDRADPNFDLEQFIDGMKLEHIQCRDFAHSWRPYNARRTEHGTYEQTLRCTRCRTLRIRELNHRGAILSSSYDYAEGYVVKGLGRIVGEDKDHLRLLSVMKVLVEDTAEET